MVSLSAALKYVKGCVANVLSRPAVAAACAKVDHTWHSGPLDPPHTVELMVRQVVEGNVAGSGVVRLGDGRFTEAAWCQAKQRLPLEVLKDLSNDVRDRLWSAYGPSAPCQNRPDPAGDGKGCPQECPKIEQTFHGHAVVIIDGSNFSMPDSKELREHFGDVPGQKPGCGFPIAHWLATFDLHTGLLLHDEASAYTTADLKHTPEAHEALAGLTGGMAEGTIVLGDDSFGGYAHIALLLQKKMHGVFPSHHARTVDFKAGRAGGPDSPAGQPKSKWIKRLGYQDQVVELSKPATRPKWLGKEQYDALPEVIQLREIRRKIRRTGFRPKVVTVVTTLLDAEEYPADEIVSLRAQRWDVETDIRHMKTTMKMEVLRSQTVQGVLKELAVFGLVYNLVRGVMLESAQRQRKAPTRLSFADALAWVRHAEEGHKWPKLKVVKARPGRVEPRAKKRRPKSFKLMNKPREEMRALAKAKQAEKDDKEAAAAELTHGKATKAKKGKAKVKKAKDMKARNVLNATTKTT